jgi:hypothetical protein
MGATKRYRIRRAVEMAAMVFAVNTRQRCRKKGNHNQHVLQ